MSEFEMSLPEFARDYLYHHPDFCAASPVKPVSPGVVDETLVTDGLDIVARVYGFVIDVRSPNGTDISNEIVEAYAVHYQRFHP